MKNLLTGCLVIQLVAFLSGCCCPCAQKAAEEKQNPPAQQAPAEEMSSN